LSWLRCDSDLCTGGEDRGEMPTKSYSNKTGSVSINLTSRRVRVTIVAVEIQ